MKPYIISHERQYLKLQIKVRLKMCPKTFLIRSYGFKILSVVYIFDYLSARCMWTSPACSIEVGVVYVVLTCTREREIIATILCLL